jgi:hypothetical protein
MKFTHLGHNNIHIRYGRQRQWYLYDNNHHHSFTGAVSSISNETKIHCETNTTRIEWLH